MAKIIRAPESLDDAVDYDYVKGCETPVLFLGGSTNTDWRSTVEDSLSNHNVIILNPHRKDWDRSWVERITNTQFKEQVEWEIRAISESGLALFNFCEGTQSPMSFLEFGAALNHDIVVCCPETFWKRGHIEVICNHFHIPIPLFTTLSDAINKVKKML